MMNKDWALMDLQRRIRRLPLKSGNQMNILTCMALYSNHDGANCFPAVDTIATETRLARRVVQIEMRRLEGAGWITCVANEFGGKGKPRVYQLNIPAGKGQQIKLGMQPLKGAANNTLSERPKGAETEAQRVQTRAPKGAESCSPIRSTLNYPISSLPGEQEPTGNPPCSGAEISPEDLPELSFAQRVVGELCLQHEQGIIHAVAGAISFCVKFDGKTKSSATEFLIAKARDEIDRGGAPTRFWFTDRRWRNGNGNGNHKTAGQQLVASNREAIIRGLTDQDPGANAGHNGHPVPNAGHAGTGKVLEGFSDRRGRSVS